MAEASQEWKSPDEYAHLPGAPSCPKIRTVRDVLGPSFPEIVCLCGSTRFVADFAAAARRETLEGKIVLSVGFFGNSESSPPVLDVKQRLDDLHLQKIALADEVLVLNVWGYIGESTGNALAYALALGKPVRTLEPLDLEKWRAERNRQMKAMAMKNWDVGMERSG